MRTKFEHFKVKTPSEPPYDHWNEIKNICSLNSAEIVSFKGIT